MTTVSLGTASTPWTVSMSRTAGAILKVLIAIRLGDVLARTGRRFATRSGALLSRLAVSTGDGVTAAIAAPPTPIQMTKFSVETVGRCADVDCCH